VEAPEEQGPLRRCAFTRERLPKERMIRFVVGPEGKLVFDLAGRLPGRGIWLSARRDVIEAACVRGTFARAASRSVAIPTGLVAALEAALARRIVEQLGLARRAGQAVAGFAKAREWLASGRAALVVQASDGSAEERQRFLAGWHGPVVAPLEGARLGAAFGRERVVHVALAAGALAERVRQEAERLAGLDGGGPTAERVVGERSGGGAAGAMMGRTQAGR
jgi:predicted RNA-binding protein YlxR (DUF448 family)